MQVNEVMHKGVISVNLNDTIKKVAQLMKEKDIGAIPVYDQSKPVGFVTDRDIVVSCVASGSSLDTPISNAMTEEIVSVHPDDDISEAARLMKEKQISRILVVDNNERPIGMLSLHDIVESSTSSSIQSETIRGIKQ